MCCNSELCQKMDVFICNGGIRYFGLLSRAKCTTYLRFFHHVLLLIALIDQSWKLEVNTTCCRRPDMEYAMEGPIHSPAFHKPKASDDNRHIIDYYY